MTIIELLEEKTGKTLAEDSPVDAMGLDSLEFVQLILDVEEYTNRKIDDRKAAEAQTIGELVQAIIG